MRRVRLFTLFWVAVTLVILYVEFHKGHGHEETEKEFPLEDMEKVVEINGDWKVLDGVEEEEDENPKTFDNPKFKFVDELDEDNDEINLMDKKLAKKEENEKYNKQNGDDAGAAADDGEEDYEEDVAKKEAEEENQNIDDQQKDALFEKMSEKVERIIQEPPKQEKPRPAENRPIVTQTKPKPNKQPVVQVKPPTQIKVEQHEVRKVPDVKETVVKKVEEPKRPILAPEPKKPAPVIEQPKRPSPVVEPKRPVPVVEQPKRPAPVVQQPKRPAPVVVEPQKLAPVVVEEPPKQPQVVEVTIRPVPAEEPNRPAPVVEKPKRPALVMEEPKRPAPGMEEPKRPAPVIEEPKRPAPVVEEPKRPAPVVEEPKRPVAPRPIFNLDTHEMENDIEIMEQEDEDEPYYSYGYENKQGAKFKVSDSALHKLGIPPTKFTELNEKNVNDFVFVSANSYKFFEESEDSLASVQKYFPNHHIIYYDLGLLDEQRERIRKMCNVEYRKYDYNQFPINVPEGIVRRQVHRAMIIQDVLKTYSGLLYMDSQFRLWDSDLSSAYEVAIANDGIVFFTAAFHSIYAVTHNETYSYIPSNTTKLRLTQSVQTGAMLIFNTEFIFDNLLKWWYLCTLDVKCVAPIQTIYCDFWTDRWERYADCHRYDQSVVNILLANMYNFKRSIYFHHTSAVSLKSGDTSKDFHMQFCSD